MFECQYCETKFLTEDKFQKHVCRQRDRMQELETVVGIAAYNFYRLWFKKRKLREPEKDTFVVSKYYTAFFKFVDFAKEKGIPDTTLYIELMSEETIQPSHWYHADIYNFFMTHYDTECSPQIHARVTILTMDKLANSFECDIKDIFNHLYGIDVAKLIQSRNLSPWILLLSGKFRDYLKNDVTVEDRKLIEEVIHINKWKIIMESKRNFIPEIKEYIKQLGI